MPDSLDDLLRKDFKLELSKFRTRTKATLAEAVALRQQRAEAQKADDDKRLKEIDLGLQKLHATYVQEADGTEARLNRLLRDYKPDAKDPRGLAKWYADMVDKESGLDVGRDLKLWGNLDFGKKEVKLELKGKF